MSQRTADELEQRRGLTLGLTLAEVLLLLLFLVLLALSWRMSALQREADIERQLAEKLTTEMADLKGAQDAFASLLAELKEKGTIDASTVRNLTERLNRLAALEQQNEALQQEVSRLTTLVGDLRALGADLGKLKQLQDALRAAMAVNPKDPVEFLTRSIAVMKILGPDTKPDDVRPRSELEIASAKLKALDRAIALGRQINPNDPAEALTRAAEVLLHVGRDAKPDDVMPLAEQASLTGNLKQARERINNLTHSGNGLTYPSCWTTPEGKTEYFLDVTIEDGGFILRDATPGRANDPAMLLVKFLPRRVLITPATFDRETLALLKSSQAENCRYYSIVRDETGSTSKVRYKQLLQKVESRFYKHEVHSRWTDVPVGGPYHAPPSLHNRELRSGGVN